MLHVTSAIPFIVAITGIIGCQRGSEPSAPRLLSDIKSEIAAPENKTVGTSTESPEIDDADPVNRIRVREASDYTRPFPTVLYDRNDEVQLKPYADQVAKLLGVAAHAHDRNPVCCVWLEITKWTPSPGARGYVINNQSGGSLIQASDTEQMQLAIERFVATSREANDGIEVPMGLLTNYAIVQ